MVKKISKLRMISIVQHNFSKSSWWPGPPWKHFPPSVPEVRPYQCFAISSIHLLSLFFIAKILKTGNQDNYISFYLDGWMDGRTDKSLKPVSSQHTLFLTRTILPMQCALAPLTWCTLYIVKKKKRRWIESSITLAHPVFKQTHENICVINKGNHGTHCNCYFKVLFNLFFIIVLIS